MGSASCENGDCCWFSTARERWRSVLLQGNGDRLSARQVVEDRGLALEVLPWRQCFGELGARAT